MAFLESPRPAVALLSGAAQRFLRQYGSIPQTLAASNVPGVSGTTGLGTGGAAGIARTPSNGASGNVDVFLGPGFVQDLTISLTFPSTPPTLFWSCNFGTFTVTTSDNLTYVLTFSEVTGIARSQPYTLHYEPAMAR